MKLSDDFYQRADVVQVARELLGKTLVTCLEGKTCRVMITETEAYAGVTDRASHAWNGRHTPRTRIMYEPGGTAYVYLCYGIHHLFNVVTNVGGVPHAVLIRGGEPLEGLETMLERRKKTKVEPSLTAGPGALAQAMGIHTQHSGLWLLDDLIFIEDCGIKLKRAEITASPRVGVDYAGADARLPYRFRIRNNRWTSKST